MEIEQLTGLFHEDYLSDRAAFERAVRLFAQRTGRSLELHRQFIDAASDLCVTVAELPAQRPERLLVLVTGIHGVEGYAGAALVRLLLSEQLPRVPAQRCGLVIVHALNPYGFAHFTRVNQNNVDLNRNCARSDEELRHYTNGAYAALAPLLSPKRPIAQGASTAARFALQLLVTRARVGELAVRKATLGGQYTDPSGVFWGGDRVQPEMSFFQGLYERLAARYPEILLIDLHTGYGDPGQAYALFGRSDTPSIAACSAQGVRTAQGRELTYEVFGDLVQYCHDTSKRRNPTGIFDGLALELGTHGLSLVQQLKDLYTVVQENQLRHQGAQQAHNELAVRRAFRELFLPSDAAWRARALRNGARAVEGLLKARGFLGHVDS